MKKAGISLVALVITIIVLIILTGAVIITGINAPTQANLAVFYNNVSQVQDAITLKMMNNVSSNATQENVNLYKWVGVVSGYTNEMAQAGTLPTFTTKTINGIQTAKLDSSLKNDMSITQTEFDKYYIDNKGVLYNEGFEYEGNTYYNRMTNTATTPTVTTLGDLVQNNAQCLGKTVNYSANGKTDWKILYEDEAREYVYLIAENYAEIMYLTSTWCGGAEGTAEREAFNAKVEMFTPTFYAGYTPYSLTAHSGNYNSKSVSWLITNNLFTVYGTPTDTSISSYVKGAIGGPTIELYCLAWNAVEGTDTNGELLTLTPNLAGNGYGYYINGNANAHNTAKTTFLTTTVSQCWMTSPSAYDSRHVLDGGWYGIGYHTNDGYADGLGMRPVICLDSNIPATIGGVGETDFVI